MFERVVRATIGCCVLAAVLVGCAPQHPPAEIVAPTPFASVQTQARVCGDDVAEGRVPDGFEPTGVYVCETITIVTLGTPPPTPSAATTLAPPLTGDLAPLLNALAEPNDPHTLAACTEDWPIVPDVWLVDAEGRAVHAAYPVDECGKPKSDEVSTAIAELRSGR
jgi:hypothetical protein